MSERTAVIEPYLRIGQAVSEKRKKTWRIPGIRLFGELLSRETAGSILAIILLARLRLLGQMAPFGLVLWAVAARDDIRRLTLYGLVLLAAVYPDGGITVALGQLAGMSVFFLLRFRVKRFRIPFVLLAGLVYACSALPYLIAARQPYALLVMGLETLLAVLGTAVFLQVYAHPPAKLSFLSEQIEGIISWIVFAGLLLLALIHEDLALAFLASGIARVVTLWAAYCFGSGMGAATGALLGFLLGIQGSILWTGILTFAGFFGGLFRMSGRLSSAVAFFLGTGALTLYVFGYDGLSLELSLSGAACLVFLIVPLIPGRMKSLLPEQAADEGERMRELTAARIHDYCLVFKELAAAFSLASTPKEAEKEGSGLAALLEKVTENVCLRCPARSRCWEKDFQKTYQAVVKLHTLLARGQPGSRTPLPDYLQKYCRKKEELLLAFSLLKDAVNSEQIWQRRLAENRKFVTLQLTGLAKIMAEIAKEVRVGPAAAAEKLKDRFFHMELGIAQAARGGQKICGDYYSYLELRDGRQALVLSDGMGNGSRAQQESKAAVQLVERLLLAGFDKDTVVRTVNTILQLRSSEETFATLDVLLLDTEKGEVLFLKNGAAPSYLYSGGGVREIESPSVPLGILDEVELKPRRVILEDDALIVMVTDGIFEAAPGRPQWLKMYLAEQTYTHPQVLADAILEKAYQLCGGDRLRDDLTVLVCRAKRLKHRIRNCLAR
ncbi:MAG: SpoIIE family protein phosphatase [Bacillota bacterium]|jgi:stage II sporulation protein E|nr:SpoIIE family protein phosphatase [Bacillota bacterium]HHU29321.1 SpoIIE family protein phosphatase [Bacillota bacterium]